MKLSKRSIADRRKEIEKILIMFELKTPKVNGVFITLIRELYSYNCRWQDGEGTTEEQTLFLVDQFKNYFIRIQDINIFHSFYIDYPMYPASFFIPSDFYKRFEILYSKVDFYCDFGGGDNYVRNNIYTFINGYKTNSLDSLWSVMDERLEGWKGKFDDCFRYAKSVKVVCLDLFYQPDNIIPRGDNIGQSCIDHWNEFLNGLNQDTRVLAHFSHLQFGIHHNFYVSGAFIFKNDHGQSMSRLKSEIYNLWESAYHRLGPRYLNSNMGVGVHYSKLPAGIISKNNDKYQNFISITLNYLVNLSQLLVPQVCNYPCLDSFAEVVQSHRYKPLESSSSSNSLKPRKSHTPVSNSLVGLTSDFLQGIKLKSIEKKEIKDIKLMYALLKSELFGITEAEWGVLTNLEIFVYLTTKWSQEPFQVNDDGTISQTNDLGRLSERVVGDLNDFHKILHGLFGRFGWVFSLRISVSYVVIQHLKNHYQEAVGVDMKAVRTKFIQGIRDCFNSSFSTFKGYIDCGVFQQNVFSLDEKPKLTLLHHLFDETQNQQQSLAEYLKAQKKLKRKAETAYNKYWVETKAIKEINLFCSYTIHCENLLTQLQSINEAIRNTIDQLMKNKSKKIYAYLGGLDILGQDKLIQRAKLTLCFSVDTHDIATRQEFVDYVYLKLLEILTKFNDKQQDKKIQIIPTLASTGFDKNSISEQLGLKDASIGQSMDVVKVWFYYLSHKSFYLVTLPYDQKKSVIKGLSSYKSRKKKPKSQLKKFEVNTDIGEKSST